MRLAAYLDRIGYAGATPRPDGETLAAVQRAHLLGVTYENLDVFLGRAATLDPAAAFAKIIERGRGGWCYEMNGLFGWALSEIGFSVTRLAGAVVREVIGPAAVGNHLVLRVDLAGEVLIADAGLGADCPLQPFALREGPFGDGRSEFRLERTADGWWRMVNRDGGRPPYFDFRPEQAGEADLERTCFILQTDPASMFRRNLICQRMTPTGRIGLIGRTLTAQEGAVIDTRELADTAEFEAVLAESFGLIEPEAGEAWRRVLAIEEEAAA